MDERFYNFGIKSEISSRRELWDYLLNKKKKELTRWCGSYKGCEGRGE